LQSESATTQETYNSIPRHDAEKHDPPMYAYLQTAMSDRAMAFFPYMMNLK